MNVTGTCVHNLQFTLSLSSGLILPESIVQGLYTPAVAGATLQYANGTGALAVDQIYAKALTLSATTQTIDLTSLPFLDGSTAAAGRVRELVLFNPDANATHIVKLYAGAATGCAFLPPVANFLTCAGLNGSIRLSDPNSTGASVGQYVDGTHKNLVVDTGAFNVTFYLLMACSSVA
jgi:hypothetical protein